MNIERKWIYIAVAAFFMALVMVPSVFFVNAFKSYFCFLDAWSIGTLRPSRVEHLPPLHIRRSADVNTPAVRFVKFSLRVPKAKAVRLAADFNRWQPQTLLLGKKPEGVWETVIPLPKGTYKYLFEVDGTLIPDPHNAKSAMYNGKKVSLKAVE